LKKKQRSEDLTPNIPIDVSTLVVASALATIAVGLIAFALLAGIGRTPDLFWAGLLAGLYAFRMIVSAGFVHSAYVHSSLEYLVPIPAALLFAHYFGVKMRRINMAIVLAFVGVAAVAIPYEVITGRPHALNPVENALVLLFMGVFAVNVTMRLGAQRSARLIRIGAIVFGLYVVNEHLRFVTLPFRLSSEPAGFLFFMLCVVVALMRNSITTEAQLLGVESELATAREIQQSIIPPHPPDVAGLDVAALYRPASQVGGDFYDFVLLPDGRLGIFIADVSGHGVPAALVASMLKIALAAQEHVGEPAEVLRDLNALFCGRLKKQFFTAAYALFDPLKQSLTFASGGHPPLMIANGTAIRELPAPGFVLGRMRSATFEAQSHGLSSGDTVLLYTDGIVEATDRNGEQWGYERLRECLETNRHASAREIADRVVGAVTGWNPRLEDDLTLVVVKTATRGTTLP